MYSTATFYMAVQASTLLTLIQYPIIAAGVPFFFFEFKDSSFTNYCLYVGSALIMGICGATFGFMFGTFSKRYESTMELLRFCCMVLNFGAGLFASVGKSASYTVRFLSWISPQRYGCELILRAMLNGNGVAETLALEHFGYIYGSERCFIFLACFIVLAFFAGMICLILRARYI